MDAQTNNVRTVSIDDVFPYLDHSWWDDELGNSSEWHYWACLSRGPVDVDAQRNALECMAPEGETWAFSNDDSERLAECVGWMVHETPQGFRTTTLFTPDEQGTMDSNWGVMESEWNEYNDDDTDDEQGEWELRVTMRVMLPRSEYPEESDAHEYARSEAESAFDDVEVDDVETCK